MEAILIKIHKYDDKKQLEYVIKNVDLLGVNVEVEFLGLTEQVIEMLCNISHLVRSLRTVFTIWVFNSCCNL